MTEYTRKEKEAINTAWMWLEKIAEHDGRNYMLDKVFKREKKDRATTWGTKALLMQSFKSGFDNPTTPISELHGISEGCQWCMTLGAGIRGDLKGIPQIAQPGSQGDAVIRFMKAYKAAHDADHAQTQRMLEAI